MKANQGGFSMQQNISRRSLLFLLLSVDPQSKGIGGITRLQKLMFLLEKEERVESSDGFHFEAYKAGPYSPKIYDDLEFLENLGLIKGTVAAEASEPEAVEVDRLSFDHLMDIENEHSSDRSYVEGPATADTFEERKYQLTDLGRKHLDDLLKSGDFTPLVDKIRRIKSKFGRHSLNDLLYYVYTKYPEMTTESEIRDRILRRGPRR